MSSAEYGELLERSGQPRIGKFALSDELNAKQRMFAKGRLKSGEMNGTEKKYAAQLEARKYHDVDWYKFEGIKLRLADNTFYTPDFFLMKVDGTLECHEVKGFWQDDAKVKIKVAAAMFPFRFVAMKLIKGAWQEEEF